MKNRVVMGGLGLCFLMLMGLFLRPLLVPALAQTPPVAESAAASAVGRYQLSYSSTGATYLLDTVTGRLWHYSGTKQVETGGEFKLDEGHWVEMGPSIVKSSLMKP